MTTRQPPIYRCYGTMDRRGRWRVWRFCRASGAEHARQVTEAVAAGHVLFASVQRFAPPRGFAGTTTWRRIKHRYKGEDPIPHVAPLYFDIDCDGDLDRALAWARALVEYFTGDLKLPGKAVRVWFSGSKGAHVLVDPIALGIEPSATLTGDMKIVATQLTTHLAACGAIDRPPALDASVYSMPRMLRVPDQLHPRSGLYKVELSHDELMTCTPEQVMELAARPRGARWADDDRVDGPVPEAAQWWSAALARAQQPRRFRIETAKIAGLKVRPDGYVIDELVSTATPSCIKGMLSARPRPGVRNRCELQIACWAKAANVPYGKALSALSAWSDRNRPELSTAAAAGKAESILSCVYAGRWYGFSCAAARSACRAAGFEPACSTCTVVRQRNIRRVHSLRVRHDAQWSPPHRISLEESRDSIASAIGRLSRFTRAA